MQTFSDWFHEASFNVPVPFKPRRKPRRPSYSLDDFVREMELLKQDLDRLSEKKRRDRDANPKGEDKPKKPIKAEVNDDLVKTAKIVLSNLKSAPNYYARRDQIDRLAGLSKEPISKKVSRQDAAKIAKELGVDFGQSKFTPEAFRKGIESEIQRKDQPPLFDRLRRRDDSGEAGADPVRPGVAGDRLDRGD